MNKKIGVLALSFICCEYFSVHCMVELPDRFAQQSRQTMRHEEDARKGNELLDRGLKDIEDSYNNGLQKKDFSPEQIRKKGYCEVKSAAKDYNIGDAHFALWYLQTRNIIECSDEDKLYVQKYPDRGEFPSEEINKRVIRLVKKIEELKGIKHAQNSYSTFDPIHPPKFIDQKHIQNMVKLYKKINHDQAKHK